MEKVSIIGLDLAKRRFQMHGARADGGVAFRKTLSRDRVLAFLAERSRCVVAMEACGSAHHWCRFTLIAETGRLRYFRSLLETRLFFAASKLGLGPICVYLKWD